MIRMILGTIIGLVAASITIAILQMAMVLVVTPPTPELMADPVKMKEWVSSMPASANLILAFGYLAGSFVGGFIATKIARGSAGFMPSVLVGVLLTVAGIVNFFFALPGSPIWAIVLCLLIYVPFSLIGHRAAK